MLNTVKQILQWSFTGDESLHSRKMVLAALLIACSYIGANIKIMGTVAFDSMPGFLGALQLGWSWGALIGAAGHFLTALLTGFMLSLPVHLEIMCVMAAAMAVFGAVYRRLAGKGTGLLRAFTAGGAAVLINGPVGVAVLSPQLLPVMGEAGLVTLVWILSLAAAVNIAVAFSLYRLLNKKLAAMGVRYDKN